MSRIPTDVNVAMSKARIDSGSYDQSLTVVAGGTTTILVTPPVGELWRVKGLFLNVPAPAGATAGSHNLSVGIGTVVDANGRNLLISATSNFGDAISTKYNYLSSATGTNGKIPTTEQAQQAAILNLVITNAKPLLLFYANSTTGGNQNGTINIGIIREVENIS